MPECSWCRKQMPIAAPFCSKLCHEAWWEAFKADLEARALKSELIDGEPHG